MARSTKLLRERTPARVRFSSHSFRCLGVRAIPALMRFSDRVWIHLPGTKGVPSEPLDFSGVLAGCRTGIGYQSAKSDAVTGTAGPPCGSGVFGAGGTGQVSAPFSLYSNPTAQISANPAENWGTGAGGIPAPAVGEKGTRRGTGGRTRRSRLRGGRDGRGEESGGLSDVRGQV